MTDMPMQTQAASAASSHLPRVWLWFVVMGVLQVILGVIALGSPLVMGLVTAVFIGWVLIVGGVLSVIHGIAGRQWRGFFVDLLTGVLYVVLGFMVVANPGLTLLTVALLVAMFLIISGIFRMVVAVAERFPHWGWMLLNGVISLLLGLAIWRQWPVSGLWVVGLFVGIEMLLHGWSLIMLGLVGRRMRSAITASIA